MWILVDSLQRCCTSRLLASLKKKKSFFSSPDVSQHSLLNPQESFNPLFKVILCSESWVRKLAPCPRRSRSVQVTLWTVINRHHNGQAHELVFSRRLTIIMLSYEHLTSTSSRDEPITMATIQRCLFFASEHPSLRSLMVSVDVKHHVYLLLPSRPTAL